LDENAAEKRAQLARQKLQPVVDSLADKTFLTSADVIRGFKALGDPYSLKIAKEIGNEEFIFEIVEDSRYPERVHHYDRLLGTTETPLDKIQAAYYYPTGTTGEKGVMVMKSISMARYEGLEKMDEYFQTLRQCVHEYRHHRDMKPQHRRTREIAFREELMAFGREFLWAAEHGDIEKFSTFHEAGFAGFALHFRD